LKSAPPPLFNPKKPVGLKKGGEKNKKKKKRPGVT